MPPTDLPERTGSRPAPPPSEPKHGDEHWQRNVPGMMLGAALLFVGFLNVLLSISGGFEINIIPLILYFAGLAVWAHSTIANPAVRYTIITLAIAMALVFYQYGEVHFWHKQVVFWSTVALVTFFMFRTAAPDKRE